MESSTEQHNGGSWVTNTTYDILALYETKLKQNSLYQKLRYSIGNLGQKGNEAEPTCF